jgi:hypothetical protein
MDVVVEAADRPGLLRDITEVFAKEKINVTGVHTQSAKDRSSAWMTFTVEAPTPPGCPRCWRRWPGAGRSSRAAALTGAARCCYTHGLPQARSSAG